MVSIVFPIYNVENYIENCMRSVCSLEYRDFEVILVNDGSKDSSIELASKILLQSNINFEIINQDNRGLSAARNIGIKHSKGEWVVCVDPDDVLCKEYLSFVEQSTADVIVNNYRTVGNDNLFEQPEILLKNRIILKREALDEFLKRKLRIVVPAMIIKRDYFISNNLWFDEQALFGEDQPFIWNVLFTVNFIEYNDSCLYNYFRHENSIMTSSDIKKIVSGYNAYLTFIDEKERLNCYKDVLQMIIPRWVLGVLRSVSKNRQKSKYKNLVEKLEMSRYLPKLMSFPDWRVQALALMFKISPMMFYYAAGRL